MNKYNSFAISKSSEGKTTINVCCQFCFRNAHYRQERKWVELKVMLDLKIIMTWFNNITKPTQLETSFTSQNVQSFIWTKNTRRKYGNRSYYFMCAAHLIEQDTNMSCSIIDVIPFNLYYPNWMINLAICITLTFTWYSHQRQSRKLSLGF